MYVSIVPHKIFSNVMDKVSCKYLNKILVTWGGTWSYVGYFKKML